MKLYWPSAIIQDSDNKRPWLRSTSQGEISLEKAMMIINYFKDNHTVLSAWVDSFDECNNKQTVFHECYIDAFGNVY